MKHSSAHLPAKTLALITGMATLACSNSQADNHQVDLFDPDSQASEICEANHIPESDCTKDCNGEWGGRAAFDECGACVGGATGLQVCRCGDGSLNPQRGEACDDGNDSNQDACLNTCVAASCGDGFVHTDAEACDEGAQNGSGPGKCTADCSGIALPAGMVQIPAGKFIYGQGDKRSTDAFLIDLHEVTALQYKECVDAGACRYEGSSSSPDRTYQNAKDNHPINYVNWQDTKDYCAWRGKRLPTEVEWEKAARGTDGRAYPWGDDAPACRHAVMHGCSTGTQPVGSKPDGRSPYGAYDMSGNVFEWTDSWWSANQNFRILRGGSFSHVKTFLGFLSAPYSVYPSLRAHFFGFRCVQ